MLATAVVTVLIIDQQRTFADAVAERLELEKDVEVVAAIEARTPALYLIMGKRADVMLLDGDLKDNAAVLLCNELSRRDEAPHVVVLSSSSEPQRIVEAVRAGAVGWVRKDESFELLLRVIRGVCRGETWLPPAETGQVLRLLFEAEEKQTHTDRLLGVLTSRERQVLAHLADGACRREVAERMCVSVNTVRTHVQNLMAKLDVHSTTEAVALTRSAPSPAPSAGALSR